MLWAWDLSCFRWISYGHDAVLLANFIRAHRGQRLLDLGTGTGIIALLAHAKTGAVVDAVDLSQASCSLAAKSVARNGLAHAISVLQADLRLLPDARLTRESFDCVVCNPPYYASGTEAQILHAGKARMKLHARSMMWLPAHIAC